MVGKVHNGVLTDNGKNTFWSRTASCAVRCASIVDAPSFSLPPHRESSLKLGLLISEHSEYLQTTGFISIGTGALPAGNSGGSPPHLESPDYESTSILVVTSQSKYGPISTTDIKQ